VAGCDFADFFSFEKRELSPKLFFLSVLKFRPHKKKGRKFITHIKHIKHIKHE